MGKLIWTYEKVKKEALKYNIRTELRYAEFGAYKRARINGWLDEFFPKEEIPEGFKKCTKCKTIKLISEFYICKDKIIRNICKICSRMIRTGTPPDHRKCLICKKVKDKTNYKNNNVKCNECHENSASKKLINNLKGRMWRIIRGKDNSKRSVELIGCLAEFLKQHLKKQFYDNMSWNNYGAYWHVDHVIPCKEFDLRKEEEQKKCFHWTNLQPLTIQHNLEKGSKTNWVKP